MPLSANARLGPYEIVSPLGAGGMGEVYRARDTRLGRTVAIKVLPPHVAGDPDRRQRFEREARSISSLNHPHICTLHDVGHHEGIDFLVMEFLEGETLEHRLAKGLLPTDQVLRYAVEIADALDKAHRQGVIHRDLKPANIMLTKSGAKLLDFGLAKLRQTDSRTVLANLSTLPTEEGKSLTGEGTILGTLQYMAPEQLEGKEADARTDIFAFGVVVYEMATGQKAFEGRSQASLIAAILDRDPPPISTLQPMTPPALDWVVKICLRKDPEERWQMAHDLELQLRRIAEAGSQASPTLPSVSGGKARGWLGWLVAGILLLGLLATLPAVIAYFSRAPSDASSIRFSISPPEKVTFAPSVSGSIALSPDGRYLAFVATGEGRAPLLWIRPLDSLEARLLPGTEGAAYPFWSPDSRFIGFFAQSKLKRIEVSGGLPQTICGAEYGRGGTWNREGMIVFAPRLTYPLHRVAATGGAPAALTELTQTRGVESDQRWPQFLPDGHHFLYLAVSGQPGKQGIYAGSLDLKDSKQLLNIDSRAVYAPPGYLLFHREGTLMEQAFDPKSLQVRGEPFPVLQQIGYSSDSRNIALSVSDNGVLAYQSGGDTISQLVWFDRGGKKLGSVGPPNPFTWRFHRMRNE